MSDAEIAELFGAIPEGAYARLVAWLARSPTGRVVFIVRAGTIVDMRIEEDAARC